MSEETFGANLATMLQAASDSEIAGALTRNFDWLISLPPLQTTGSFPRPMLPPLGALGIFLGMRALMRSGQASEAWPFLEEAVAAYVSRHTTSGHRPYARQAVLRDALSDYDNLRIVTVEALMATGQTTEAAGALLGLTREVIRFERPTAFTETSVGPLAALAEHHRLGPTWHTRDWLIAHQRLLVSNGTLDESKAHTWSIYAEYLISALSAGATEEALRFVEAKTDVAWPIEDRSHYGFNVICVFSHAGLTERAIVAAHELIRRGYDLLWRFNRSSAEQMGWVKDTGQLEWLAPLEGIPAFEALRSRYLMSQGTPQRGPRPGPFQSLELTTFTGRTRKRCVLSRELITPGEAICRFYPYFYSGDEPLLAKKTAFESSAFGPWLVRHRSDTYSPADFSPPSFVDDRERFDAPAAAAFLFDLYDGAAFDVDAFIACIAAPKVFPMRYEWVRNEFDYVPEPKDGPYVNDAHAGDYVSLTWIMLRCGYGSAIFSRLNEIDSAIADPIFAMLSTFSRSDCRAAASAHFGLDALPQIIDVAFQSHLSLDDILSLAAFGRDNPRFADALAQALATYNLHIYSNGHPQADWYLEDLQHYIYAKGTRLAFFFIHTPERLPVLATMLENRWLVTGVGTGGYDGYRNTCHSLFQAAAINRLIHAPEEASFWLETPWIERYVRGPTLRETRRYAKAYLKRTSKPRKTSAAKLD